MQCMSCQAPIHPEFVHSIKSNICPACGGPMMNEAAQELIEELGAAFSKMPNDPQGIAGWLLSNYELRKIGTGEPVNEFYGTPKQGQKGQQGQTPGTLKVPENRIQKFLKQAGVKQVKKPEDYADIVQEINGVDYGDGNHITVEENEEFVEEAKDPVYTQQVLSAMQTQPTKPGKATMPGAAAASGDLDKNVNDLPPALREDRMRRLQQQLEVGQGGKVGTIRRH